MATTPRKVQTLRSSTPGQRPAPNSQPPGVLYTNWPDNALGVINASQNPVDLLPIRFFSTLASYVVGDFVRNGTQLYRANAAVSPGAFNATQWDLILTAAGGGGFVQSFNTRTGAVVLTPADISSAGGALLAGPTFTGVPAAPNPTPGDYSTQIATTKFVSDAIAAGAPIAVSDTPPGSPNNNMLWWDSIGGNLYLWYNDGNSSQWVAATNQAGMALIAAGSSPPASPPDNQLWWDSNGGQLYIYYNDGNTRQWVVANNIPPNPSPLAVGSGGTGASNAANALANLGGFPKQGVTDGSNAAAGQVGEYLTATNSGAMPSSGTVGSPGSISLTAGDWDVWALITYSGTTFSYMGAGLSTVVNNLGGSPAILAASSAIFVSSGPQNYLNVPMVRFNLTATTTIYLGGYVGYSAGSANWNSTINARRVR